MRMNIYKTITNSIRLLLIQCFEFVEKYIYSIIAALFTGILFFAVIHSIENEPFSSWYHYQIRGPIGVKYVYVQDSSSFRIIKVAANAKGALHLAAYLNGEVDSLDWQQSVYSYESDSDKLEIRDSIRVNRQLFYTAKYNSGKGRMSYTHFIFIPECYVHDEDIHQ